MIKNYTSQVPAWQSIASIERQLIGLGARGILKEYDADGSGRISALCFQMPATGGAAGRMVGIRLPGDVEAVKRILLTQYRRVKPEVEQLIIRMASENRSWGYDRIAGALANLGHEISDQTVGNVLRRHGLPPAPERKRTTTWAAFIRTHMDLLAGTDFFTAEVLTLRGLVTYYVLFFIHLGSRRVAIGGITVHPNETWMKQMARNATMDEYGALLGCRYLLHDRDTKFTCSFRAIIASDQVKPLQLPARSPNLNALTERSTLVSARASDSNVLPILGAVHMMPRHARMDS